MRLTDLTLFELSERVNSGEICWEDVVEAYREQIRRYDDDLKAYITVNESGQDPLKGAISGAPVAIKDNICTR
ncbi:MAG: hypothetical protein ACUVQ5_06480, partial [Candidatus Methanomethylicaceae archaeon]